MKDDQIIYLGPEEDLTSIRERLEQTQAQRVRLVVPAQTQLRSLVSWRVLHSRIRELGKDVEVISSDRQIRAVARTAGFRVGDSMEATPTGKTGSGSRPSRFASGGRTTTSTRSSNRSTVQRTRADRAEQATRQPARTTRNENITFDDVPVSWQEPTTQKPYEEEHPIQDITASSIQDIPVKNFSSPFPFAPEMPSIQQLSPEEDEDEADSWLEDFKKANSIREAARTGTSTPDTTPQTPREMTHNQTIYEEKSTPQRPEASTYNTVDDPFSIEDIPPSPLPEQQASIPYDSLLKDADELPDYQTRIIDGDLIDDGDLGVIDLSPRHDEMEPPPHSSPELPEQEPEESEEDLGYNPSRVHGFRPRASRTGRLQNTRSNQPRQRRQEAEEDEPLPIDQMQTQIITPGPASRRSTGQMRREDEVAAAPAAQANVAATPPTRPQRGQKQTQTRQKNKGRRVTGTGTLAGASASRNPRRSVTTGQQSHTRRWVTVLMVALIVIAICILIYVGPSADITVTLPARSYTQPVTLVANTTAGSQTAGFVPSHTLTYTNRVTGQGTATGTTRVGTLQASGYVVFINKGSQQIDIPTGTVLSTPGGVNFVTQADALILPANNNYNLPVPVQAQNPGESGNVPANSITNITAEGQSKIQQANAGVTLSNLSVSNPKPTSGGGTGNATSVTSNDAAKEKAALDKNIQTQIQSWLNSILHPGDQTATPQTNETVITTPTVGNPVKDGTFTETISYTTTVLVVSARDIQAAAARNLNMALSQDTHYINYNLVPSQPITFTNEKTTSASNGSSLTITMTATAPVVPKGIEQILRSSLAGKQLSDLKKGSVVNKVQHYLITNPVPQADPTYKELDTTIDLHPGWLIFIPLWQNRITIHIVPVLPPGRTK